jgi:hypothetical protein
MLFVFGAGIVVVVAIVFGGLPVVSPLISTLFACVWRLAVIVVCGLLIGVVGESLR